MLQMHRESAHWAIAKAQDSQAKSYNKGRHPAPEFKEGDRVLVNPHSLEWVKSKGDSSKLRQWWIGPFQIMQKVNLNIYRLHMSNRYPGLPIFNIDHLRKYEESPTEFGEQTALPETCLKVAEQREYEVKKLVGHHHQGHRMEYLIRWKDYRPLYDMWESQSALRNAPEVLHQYKQEHNLWSAFLVVISNSHSFKYHTPLPLKSINIHSNEQDDYHEQEQFLFL